MQNLGKVVSIVDDDSDIVQLFHDALEHLEGVNIFTFTDPIAALQHFQENEYAYVLVISDYKMPGLNGVELVNKVKSLNQFVRTILMSAFEVDDIRFQQYAKKKIINAYLQKPIRMHDLLLEVDTQLHSYEMQKCYPTNV